MVFSKVIVKSVARPFKGSFSKGSGRLASFNLRMRARPDRLRKIMFACLAGFAVTACQSGNLGSATDGLSVPPQQIALTPNPQGEVFGQGTTRVTLMVPKTAAGNGASVASEIRNGALLAMQDFGQSTIQLVIKDTKGQAADAQAMASEAISEGSSAILGPLFSSSVNAASAITQPGGKTMVAFSNDASVARRGVYLLSYTQQADTRRMINYALSLGKRSIHAFLPDTAVGTLQEAVLRELTGRTGASVQISKYERSGPGTEQSVRDAAVPLASADAIYIPEGGQLPEVIVSSIKRIGIPLEGKQILGSGQWESVKFGSPDLDGALYTGRDIRNFAAFSSRYQSAYGSQPGVFAALGYDAVTLVTKLVQDKGPQQAFTPASIEDRRGFAGINGIFRLLSDGTSQRGLAVYKVSNGAGTLESPAPTSFSGT